MNPEQISEVERHYHDMFASKFDSARLLKWFEGHLSDPIWKDLLPFLTGHRALDLGCGLGFDSVLLARMGFEVTGVDISPTCVDKARNLAQMTEVGDKCSFKVMDLNMSSIHGEYDLVFGRAVLHHLTARPLEDTLRMLRANVSPGGRMVFVEPLDRNPAVLLNRRALDVHDRTPTERPLNLWRTLEAFRRASLRVRHKEYYLSSTFAYFWKNAIKNDSMFRASQSVLTRFDVRLMDRFSLLRGYAWLTLMSAEPLRILQEN